MARDDAPQASAARLGVSSATADSTATPAIVSLLSATSYADRIRAMFGRYAPEKLSSVDTLMVKYAGHEVELLDQIVAKYGPEPHAAAPASSGTNSCGQLICGAARVDSITRTLCWITGVNTVFCGDWCLRYGESVANMFNTEGNKVRTAALKESMAGLCDPCRAAVAKALVKVREVLRAIYTLQLKFRWRRYWKRLKETEYARLGVDMLRFSSLLGSTRGRCGRCGPMLEMMQRRIDAFNKKMDAKRQARADGKMGGSTRAFPGLLSPAARGNGVASGGPDPLGGSSASLNIKQLVPSVGSVKSAAIESPTVGRRRSPPPSLVIAGGGASPLISHLGASPSAGSISGRSKGSTGSQRNRASFLQTEADRARYLCGRCREIAKAKLKLLRGPVDEAARQKTPSSSASPQT